MKLNLLTAATLLFLLSISACAAGRNCDELKMEIAAKIEANGVKSYTLTIVKNEDVKTADNVVGSCEGGSSKIVYVRNATPVARPAGK